MSTHLPVLLMLLGVGGPPAGAPPVPGEACARLPAGAPEPVERQAYAMGTRLRVVVHGMERRAAFEAMEGAFRAVARTEALLSSWREDSELGRLNGAPVGQPVSVAPDLLALLGEARKWSVELQGAFDPGVGPLVDAWGLRGDGRVPGPDELRAARDAAGLERFHLDGSTGAATRLHPGAWLDAGAFGKGVALRRAAGALEDAGVREALLDFGGQLLSLGAGPCPDGWVVSLAHPDRRAAEAGRISLPGRSVATSGSSERFVEFRGRRLGHILDPRTGAPAPAWGSVTVVAEDPVAADVLATALFVLGPEEALRWAREREEYGVLVLQEGSGGLAARWNGAMEPYLEQAPNHRDDDNSGG